MSIYVIRNNKNKGKPKTYVKKSKMGTRKKKTIREKKHNLVKQKETNKVRLHSGKTRKKVKRTKNTQRLREIAEYKKEGKKNRTIGKKKNNKRHEKESIIHTPLVNITKGEEQKNTRRKGKIKAKKPIVISEKGYPSIFSWIASHKFYPTEALFKNEQGIVTIQFTIDRNGKIINTKLTKKSFKTLDTAAIKILEQSSPIPKKILSNSKLSFPATVILNLVFKINSDD